MARAARLFCAFAAIGLLAGLGCRDRQASVGHPAPGAPPAQPPEGIRAKLGRLQAANPGLMGEAVEDFFAEVFLHPETGPGLWSQATGEGLQDGLPRLDHMLKTASAPWLRPLLMKAVEDDLLERSEARRGHGNLRYNVVVIGAGPNGVTAALNLHQARPGLRIAVVDRMHLPGDVFRTFGHFSWINSPETKVYSTHEVPGMPWEVQALLAPQTIKSGPYFMLPYLLRDYFELAAQLSGVDFWLSTPVDRVRSHDGAPGTLEVVTRGAVLVTDRVLIATGLGREPLFGGDGPALPAGADGTPAQEHFDALSARANRLILNNRLLPARQRHSFLEPYAGKRVAIIGAGDSANVLAELAAGFAPPEAYGLGGGRDAQPGPQYGPAIGATGGLGQVLWIHQPHPDADGFTLANKPRYRATLPAVMAAFQCDPGLLGKVQPAPGGGFDLELKEADGSRRHVQADYLWYGTGYRPLATPVLRSLKLDGHGQPVPEPALEAYLKQLDGVTGEIQVTVPGPHQGHRAAVTIGRRVPDSEPLAGVFLGGTAVNNLFTKKELDDFTLTRNPASLNANLPRAAALGRHLALLPGYTPLPAAPMPEPDRQVLANAPGAAPARHELQWDPTGAGQPVDLLVAEQPSPGDLLHRRVYREMAMALLLARDLRGHGAPQGLRVQVEDLGHGQRAGWRRLRVSVFQVQPSQSQTLAAALAKDATLIRLAMASGAGPGQAVQLRVSPSSSPIRPEDIRLVVRNPE